MSEQQLPKPAPTEPAKQDSEDSGSGPSLQKQANPLPASEHPGPHAQRIPLWLQRTERLLRVIVRLYLGLLVCLVPWYPQAWDANPLFAHSPALLQFITQGYVRGLVSGLGLLNLWIALRDAIQG